MTKIKKKKAVGTHLTSLAVWYVQIETVNSVPTYFLTYLLAS